MDFHALVTAARTCRRFEEDKPLNMADLEWLADCARLAPSARNAQDLRFVLVGPGDMCGRLFALTRWAGALRDWGGPQPGERPTGFIAILLPTKSNDLHLVDTGIAAQTMQLAAASRGWGWPSAWPRKSAGWRPCRPRATPPTGGTPRACTMCPNAR